MVIGFVQAFATFLIGVVIAVASNAAPVKHAAARSTARPLVQKLSLQQLAGQRIVYSYAGLRPPQSLLAAIRDGEAGGVIFFGPNVSSAAQLRSVINELQAASRASPLHTRSGAFPGRPRLPRSRSARAPPRPPPRARPAPAPHGRCRAPG
jgi:hypothetical protein